jgi:hypothetical protein
MRFLLMHAMQRSVTPDHGDSRNTAWAIKNRMVRTPDLETRLAVQLGEAKEAVQSMAARTINQHSRRIIYTPQ